MPSDPGHDDPGRPVVVVVPELRDYHLINREVIRLLDAGARWVVLAGVGRQRLLLAGLAGSWDAKIEVDGPAGPELAAGLNAPGLHVQARGDVGDGSGSRLVAGRLDVAGRAGDGFGYAVRGGTLSVRDGAGDRAGLLQSGGLIVVRGTLGRLAGERQSGGTLVARRDRLGPNPGWGRSGGRMVLLDGDPDPDADWSGFHSRGS